MPSDGWPNLAALLTPAGTGAIAVVRLHGPNVRGFLESCFSRPASTDRCVHGEFRDGANVIDDPVVVFSSDGQTADVNLHGGTWVVQAFRELADRWGFAFVDSTCLPLSPFMVDGQVAIETEILTHLPLATTELGLRVLLAQSTAWEQLDLGEFSTDQASRLLADRSLHWLLRPPHVAIVGIPNAGKSTLANQLFGQQRSITADLPGTTRDWVGETANIDGLPILLVDTPGIRHSEDAIEMEAIARADRQIQGADAVVLVLDATRTGEPSQRVLVNRFPRAIRVLNKVDVAGAEVDSGANSGAIRTVARTGEGVDAVRAVIRRWFGCDQMVTNVARCWTQRQRELVGARMGRA